MSHTTIAKPTSTTTHAFGWVLASIQEMTEESIYFCETFSHTLNAHHNSQAAAVFKQALQSFQQEEQLLIKAIQNHGQPLPKISPWEKPYQDYQHPAATLMDADYLMTESDAWQLVEKMIQVHHGFYRYLREYQNRETQNSEKTLKLVSLLVEHCSHCLQDSQYSC